MTDQIKKYGDAAMAQDVIKAYAEDLDGFTRDECSDLDIENDACSALMNSLGRGAEGKVTSEEARDLSSYFSAEFVGELRKENGTRALKSRAKWLGDHAVNKWWRRKMDVDERRKMIFEVGDMGSAAAPAVTGLLEVLKDGEFDIRLVAAMALGKIGGGDKVVGGLVGALKDEEWVIQRYAIELLGEMGSDKAVPGLLELLKDERLQVRFCAIEALRKIGSDRSVQGLVGALRDEIDGIRRLAIQTLGEIGSDEAVPALLEALKNGEYIFRNIVATALIKIGGDKAVPELVRQMLKGKGLIRFIASDILEAIGGDEVVSALIKALVDSGGGYVDYMISHTLIGIGSDEVVSELLKILKSDKHGIKGYVMEMLGEIGRESAVPGLLVMLTGRHSVPNEALAWALKRIGNYKMIISIRKLFESNDFKTRCMAARALQMLASDYSRINKFDPKPFFIFIPLLDDIARNDPDAGVRREAKWASEALKERVR